MLLTPGPYSETYFEHAYLARYLGLPLVEGGDLTVRGERLFLKTVDGLEPVHGVLRRLDDDWCDPLELRPDSALGVPGLLQAARAGTRGDGQCAGQRLPGDAGGAGLPARHRAPAAGREPAPAVAAHLVVRRGRGLARRARPTWRARSCAAPSRTAARTSQVHEAHDAAIEADPDAWTVQGRLRFSRAPIWGTGAVTPRPAMVRVYAIADAGGRWHVLPGGMTRVARREDSSVSMQRGGTSLDTWVLTDGPVDTFSMLPQRLQVDDILARRQPVTSRTGENLFWLGRYTERTEKLVRLARATLLLIDADGDAPPPVLQALSALAVTQRPGAARRADAGASRRTCSSARCWPGWPDRPGRGRGQHRLQPGGAGARVAGAARAPVVRAVGPDALDGRRLRAGAGDRAGRTADAGARCCRRWTAWPCSWRP